MRHGTRMLMAGAVAAAVAASTGAVDARDLVYGAWVSAKHGIMVHSMPPYFEAIEKDTGGAVKWKLVAGGQLVSGKTTLPGIRDGVIDAGLIIPSYTPRELPGNNVIMGVQVFGEDTVAASAAAVETVMLHCPQCLDDFRKQNAVYLGGHAATPFYLMCAKPVTKLADVTGKKVRSSGSGNRLVKALGGVPVPMDPAEALLAMERGAIDCVLGAIAWLQSYGFMDVVTHFVNYPLGIVGGLGFIVVNRDTWNGMTAEQKAAHLRHAPLAASRAIIKAYVEEDIRILRLAKEKGINVVDVGKTFDAPVAAFVKEEERELIDTSTKLGAKDPEKILRSFQATLAKWQKLSPEIGADVDKYAAAIKREIYDRVDAGKL